MLQPSQSYRRTWMLLWLNMECTRWILKVSWPTVPKRTGMLFESYTGVEMRLRRWWTERRFVFSIGRSPWRNIPRPISVKTCNTSIEYYASNTRMRNRWQRQRQKFLAIRAWWMSSGAATEQALPRLELWLAFWHFHYRQWGGFMELVSLYFPSPCLYSSLFIIYLQWFCHYSNSESMGIAESKWSWTSGNTIL